MFFKFGPLREDEDPPVDERQGSAPAEQSVASPVASELAVWRSRRLEREIETLRQRLAKVQLELTRSQDRERRARYLAFHDDLTTLPNRRLFRERLNLTLRNTAAGPGDVAVMYLDMDGFKTLNDTYGHDVGDELLNLMAARLARVVRAEDLVSRLGGDEFACLITGVSSRERLQQIASNLFDVVSSRFNIGPVTLTVRPSIGIAVSPDNGITTDALMKAADTAMYEAKRKHSEFMFARIESINPLMSLSHGRGASCVHLPD